MLRIVGRAVALVTMLAVAVVTLPTATAAVVTCCCGDHDAHHDCGCVDCPAGDGNHRGDGSATMKSCRSRSAEVTLAAHELDLTPVDGAVRVLPESAPALVAPALDDRAADPPPSPPPRR
ncbi:MAG: hypothetical protein JNK64_41335 [Myxococcales bacterium]|nr:hypothetical protein [Myxococcales bacterium]